MDIPQAMIVHRSACRIRIRVHSQKGNVRYFSEVRARLSECRGCESVTANPLTGSILICGGGPDTGVIMEFAESNRLFHCRLELSTLVNPDPSGKRRERVIPLPMFIVQPLRFAGSVMSYVTSGRLNLSGLLFLTLIGAGIHGVATGRKLSMPPWYTAFWYAHELSKTWEMVSGDSNKNPEPTHGNS